MFASFLFEEKYQNFIKDSILDFSILFPIEFISEHSIISTQDVTFLHTDEDNHINQIISFEEDKANLDTNYTIFNTNEFKADEFNTNQFETDEIEINLFLHENT